MDEDRENQIEDHKQQQLKLKIIKSSDWNIGDDERKPSVIKNEIDDDNEENQIDQVHHHHHVISTTPPPLPRICEYCGKGFSSGKALGGHKRYHIQEARKYGVIIPRKTMKLKLKKHKVLLYDDVHHGTSSPSPSSAKINSSSQQEEKEKSTCCLCQKEFPSKKSLFGHMRSHRDRDWRGIQPPPMMMSSDRSRSSSCSPPMAAEAATEMKKQQPDHDDHDGAEGEAEDYYNRIENSSLEFTESRTFEPVEVLRTWCKTDKRGRKSIGDQVAAERLVSLSLGEQEQEQQQSLMMMKKIGSKISGYDSDDSYWLREDQELELDHHVDKQHQHQQQWSMNVNVKKNVDYGSYQGRQHQPSDYDVVSNKRKMTTAKKDKFSYSEKRPRKSGEGLLEVNNLDGGGGGGGGGVRKKPKTSFKCSSCGKSFPTFQALGGHRSSHNKDKHTNNPHTLAEDSAEVGIHGHAGAGNNQVQVKVDHVTSKSKYNEKMGTGGKSSSSQVDDQDQAALMTSEASESSQTGPRKVLDFDLNETYVMEDDEEEGAN